MKFLAITLFLLVCGFTIDEITTWNIRDEEYSIRFDTRMVHGSLKGLSGNIRFDATNLPQSDFDMKVDVRTIDTGIRLKNRHALGEGFLNAENYPYIKYKSKEITRTGEGFETKGDLTIKDVTKAVTIPFTFEPDNDHGKFTGKLRINREDYNLYRWGIGKIIDIDIVVPVTKMGQSSPLELSPTK